MSELRMYNLFVIDKNTGNQQVLKVTFYHEPNSKQFKIKVKDGFSTEPLKEEYVDINIDSIKKFIKTNIGKINKWEEIVIDKEDIKFIQLFKDLNNLYAPRNRTRLE